MQCTKNVDIPVDSHSGNGGKNLNRKERDAVVKAFQLKRKSEDVDVARQLIGSSQFFIALTISIDH